MGELWRAGIACETLYKDNPKVPKQLDFALENGVPLILWIGEDEIKKGTVKVKSLNYREEYVIGVEDLIPRMKELIKANPVLLSKEEQEALKDKPQAQVSSESEDVSAVKEQVLKQLYQLRDGFFEGVSTAI